MFARPKKVSPCNNNKEVDKTFTEFLKPLLSTPSLTPASSSFSPTTFSSKQPTAVWKKPANHRIASYSDDDSSSKITAPEDISIEDDSLNSSPTYSFAKKDNYRSPPERVGPSDSRGKKRTGDYRSYTITGNNDGNFSFFLDKRSAKLMYRVLICKDTTLQGSTDPHRLLIDSLDGKIYCDGFTYRNRVAKDIVLFESKSAALSERYPCNQVGASRGGNGVYPRILVAFGKFLFSSVLCVISHFFRAFCLIFSLSVSLSVFGSLDAWGHMRRRHGGGPSVQCDNAMAMKIVQFLDPPHPIQARLSTKYVEPHFNPPADYTKPTRERSDHWFKVNRFFHL
jgi:hypothetical protein